MTAITLNLTRSQEQLLLHKYQSASVTPPPYAQYQLRPEGCVITCYNSHKTVFQGKNAAVYAAPFQTDTSSDLKTSAKLILPQAGSDEVGTGDYFGPVCVCAAIVDEKTYPKTVELGVRDSKKINDETIRKIGPQLYEMLDCSLLIVDDRKYNAVHGTYNMNALKSLLHNQAYINLGKKRELPALKVIDQFTPETSYYRYLKDAPQVVRGIHFETKAEDKYPAVGCASIIARWAFLESWDAMENRYQMKFEKGAGVQVDQCARTFIEKYGRQRLPEVAKMHFKNTERL